MTSKPRKPAPDQSQRDRALDPSHSCLVQAPAGSGKTTLLAERFLGLLAQVEEPGQVVAITFTRAAAAEMHHRIVDELRKDDPTPLALRVLQHSQTLGWNLPDLPAQLRISTIDSFCRELALQQPLLSGLGGSLDLIEEPKELYRRAARQTIEQIQNPDGSLSQAIEDFLLARDNDWKTVEDLLVEMLAQRDRWMHSFVVDREPDLDALRALLEQPFHRAVQSELTRVSRLLDQIPDARERVLELARAGCEEPGPKSPWSLAECAEIPAAPFSDDLVSALDAYSALADFLQTKEGKWRSEKGLKTTDGFPSTQRGKDAKRRFGSLILALNSVSGLESALAALSALPLLHYSEDEWSTVRASFILLRHAAAQLRVIFAETAAADFIEVAQIAERVLRDADGSPTDAAMAVADGIRHILVDEFQDTSRRQHQLLASLIAAWPEPAGRTLFTVGDPMQSIYFFRGADAELFPRVARLGLEIPGDNPFPLDFVPLTANFRTVPSLVAQLNEGFARIFEENDGSGIAFSAAEAARAQQDPPAVAFKFHANFDPPVTKTKLDTSSYDSPSESALDAQTREIVDLIRSHMPRIDDAERTKTKYRVAVLGRARKALAPIALALREASIPFRAVGLESLKDRPEVADALNLARALLNAHDRVAWLGILRAPWCGLSLEDLHKLVSADDPSLCDRPVVELLQDRIPLLSIEGQSAASRILLVLESAHALRAEHPTSATGSWLQQIWLRLGGAACVDGAARANLDLLWQSLDALPGDEPDLLGPALDAALSRLTAQPDPNASSECGVQLMTIHNSKGLEFEVVIVPDLQAKTGKYEQRMLSWLERGLPESDDSGEITEFLIAPLPRKGDKKGKAKAWVDRIYREREKQEMRRLLYVASTRAREELHWFARPICKRNRNGEFQLQFSPDSLLRTAWPAIGAEVDSLFTVWKAAQGQVESIAASGEDNLLVMPAPAPALHKSSWLRRLPSDFDSAESANIPPMSAAAGLVGVGALRLYARHEGGLVSRALGNAVHALLEELARLRISLDWPACRQLLDSLSPRIAAQIRAYGLAPAQATAEASRAVQIALDTTRAPIGQWILSPHPEAASEASWAGLISGTLRTVRVDRVFQAGSSPGSEGSGCWWIIDYKTTHADSVDSASALPELRSQFAPQLEAYAAVLRKMQGPAARIHAGLYYPRMSLFDWWDLDSESS